MHDRDTPALLVARFLRANHYDETLDTFIREASLPADAGTSNSQDLTIEKLLEEKKTFDLSVNFEKLGTDDHHRGWSSNAPLIAETVTSLPSSSNILHVSVAAENSPDTREPSSSQVTLFTTTADRRLNSISLPKFSLKESLTTLHDSPILSCVRVANETLVTSSMSGQLVLSDINGNNAIKRRDHAKYIVQIAVLENGNDGSALIATAGWDAKVNIYGKGKDQAGTQQLDAPIASINLQTNPESLVFTRHPESSDPILIVTRRDSTFLYYYHIGESSANLLGRQNLAPHSNAWIAFTPSSIALSPVDNTLLAVATSAVPHMKLIIVRLMIPPMTSDPSSMDRASAAATLPTPTLRTSLLDDANPSGPSASSVAREALALQDREAAAIQVHVSTMSPQTPYSTPALAWRPDGSGVWVNSDDGVIRGIEASSGKIVATLQGHEVGSKIRCLCAVVVGEEEWLVSGGFDQRLIVWRPEASKA